MARRPFSLTTDRLTIRPLARADITAFTRYRNLADVARYQDWELPYTRDLAHALVDDVERLNGPTADEWVQLALTDADDRLIGDLAVWLDTSEQLAVIGYTLAPEHQGRGYATEAVAAAVDWLLLVKKVHRVAATIDPDNLASARVLERTGFRYVGTAKSSALVRGVWSDDARFELLADDRRQWLRTRKPAKRVDLIEITGANVRAVGELDRAFSQRRFVSSVHQSYGDALVVPDVQGARVVAWLRAISADRQLAGFMMVAEPSTNRPHPYLWRLLVDWRHQGRGIGRLAIQELARVRADEGASHLRVSCVAGMPGSPEGFYRKLGFEPTGQINEWGETEMIAAIDRVRP